MSEANNNESMFHAPTLIERFWRKAGYRYHLGEEPECEDVMNGWICTDVRFHFVWADRLRLLLSGRLFIANIVTTDTPTPSVTKTRTDWRIVEPGGDWR